MKNLRTAFLFVALGLLAVSGWAVALNRSGVVYADEAADDATIDMLYESVFHRPADAEGKNFYRGKNIKTVLGAFMRSDEMRYYGALFKSVKSYEEAQRAPGVLSDEEKQRHLDLIDSSLSTLLAWVGTLPDQNPCQVVVTAEQAREAVQQAYERLENSGRTNAQRGLLNAVRRLGEPREINVRSYRCVSPTPSLN